MLDGRPRVPPTDDPAALVAAAQKHQPDANANGDQCVFCLGMWPCLPARLADALDAAQKNNERLELQLFNCIGGPHTGHEYTNGMTGEVTYCCPAHQDGYTWLKDAQADAAAQRARVGELERQLAIHRKTELDLIRVALTPPVPRHD